MSENDKKKEFEIQVAGTFAGATNSSESVTLKVSAGQEKGWKGDSEIRVRRLEEAELAEMFRQAGAGTIEDADRFFNGFRYVWELQNGNYSLALDLGLSLLARVKTVDADIYDTIHKGTPLYWLGMAAFLVHDYQTATFFFDAAVSEDIRAGRDPVNSPTPSFRFILIEGDQPGQAAQALVMVTQTKIEEAIADYDARPGRSSAISELTLFHIRDSFLKPALSRGKESWRSLATTFISFFLEWDYRSKLLDLRVGAGTAEPFYLHLFKGCVLFESLLKTNPHNPPSLGLKTLGKVLDQLSSDLSIAGALRIGNTTFPEVVRDLSSADKKIETAILFAGRIRNTVGHNLGWQADFDRSQYDLLAGMVASACLHAIACLYR